MNITYIKDKIIQLGPLKVEVISTSQVPFNVDFRKMCEMNSCGMYGKGWMCPPYVGEIDFLIERAKEYEYAIVYMTVSNLEDSYDIEGMLEAGEKQNKLVIEINKEISKINNISTLNLGAGGCKVCVRCGKLDEKPCRFPDIAISSLEAYGISVYELAKICGMNYINGQNTVTYFGVLFIKEK